MKVNPNYLGRLFTEQELSYDERQQAKTISSMKKENRLAHGDHSINLYYYLDHGSQSRPVSIN